MGSYNKHNEVPGYAYSRSISQPPAPAHYSGPRSVGAPPSSQGSGGAEKFRYSDYKPLPPPKSSIYKPVPPPKPKPFSRSNSQPPSMTESNYMNGNYITSAQNGQSQGPESYHYHSSRVAMGETNGYANVGQNGHPPPSQGAPNNGHGQVNGHGNGYDEMDSNGVDSGQGSSLDRDYSGYNGHAAQYNGNNNRYAAPPGGSVPSQQRNGQQQQQQPGNQYYYNLPNGGQQRGQESREAGEGASPRRRAPGDTLDLSNREYRGSAFELYKKPGYSFPSGVPSYTEAPR